MVSIKKVMDLFRRTREPLANDEASIDWPFLLLAIGFFVSIILNIFMYTIYTDMEKDIAERIQHITRHIPH